MRKRQGTAALQNLAENGSAGRFALPCQIGFLTKPLRFEEFENDGQGGASKLDFEGG